MFDDQKPHVDPADGPRLAKLQQAVYSVLTGRMPETIRKKLYDSLETSGFFNYFLDNSGLASLKARLSQGPVVSSREEWLAYCRREAERLRQQHRPWVLFVREDKESPDGVANPVPNRGYRRRGPPIGVVVVSKPAPELAFVGASFCHPQERRRFNRHEAVMRALRTLVLAPRPCTPEALEVFLPLFPRSCREHIRWMLTMLEHKEKFVPVPHGDNLP